MPKFEPKYDVNMSEYFHIRVTAEQRRLISDASLAGTASAWWRDYSVYTAEQVLKLKAGEITPDEFGSNISNFVQEYMMSATLPEQDEK